MLKATTRNIYDKIQKSVVSMKKV